MNEFVRLASGDLRWGRGFFDLVVANFLETSSLVILGIICVFLFPASPLLSMGCGVLMLVWTVHLLTWTVTLTSDGLLVVKSRLFVTTTVSRSNIHALAVSVVGRSNRGVNALINDRIVHLHYTEAIPVRRLEAIAAEIGTWAGCSVVSGQDMFRIVQARKGVPERGHPGTTTRTDL